MLTTNVATIFFEERDYLWFKHERTFKIFLNNKTRNFVSWSSRRAFNSELNTIGQNI